MKKLRSTYKNALNKHTPEEVLNMYCNSKINLNKYEWNNLHKRIYKKNNMIRGIEILTIVNAVVCFLIICLVAFNIKTTNFEKIKQCNEIQGHTCSRYEIEKISYEKENKN